LKGREMKKKKNT